jgi:hypothetical protein
MSQRYCHHVHANGVLCKAMPLRKRDYCFFHLDQIGRRMKAARARARRQPVSIDLPLFEDLYSLQVGLMKLADAVQHNEIDVERGRLLMSVLRLAASNLKTANSWDQHARFRVDKNTDYAMTECNTFEQEYGFPSDFDISQDPETAFPPPPDSTVPQVHDRPLVVNLGDDLGQTPGARFKPSVGLSGSSGSLANREARMASSDFDTSYVTADDVEIYDIMQREGDKAAVQRAGELARDHRRRERRLQRARYEEMARQRNIQIAAQKLVREQQRQAQAAVNAQQSGGNAQPPAAESQPPVAAEAAASASATAAVGGRKPPQPEAAKNEPQASSGTA